jgi:hypothetical protein
MSETVVRVDLRQSTLSEHARLREAGELAFLALDNPPPVRSLLRLIEAGAEEPRAFEVARVVEVVEDDEPARGCYGRYIELERLDEQAKVGSEHLEPGISSSGGVPAPVVIMNTSEMMLGEAGEESEDYAARDGDEDEDEDEDEGESEAASASDDEGDSEAEASSETDEEADDGSDEPRD